MESRAVLEPFSPVSLIPRVSQSSPLFIPFSCHRPLNSSICLSPHILLRLCFSEPIFLPFFPSCRFSVQLGSISPGTEQAVNEALFVCWLPEGSERKKQNKTPTSPCQLPQEKRKKTRNTNGPWILLLSPFPPCSLLFWPLCCRLQICH